MEKIFRCNQDPTDSGLRKLHSGARIICWFFVCLSIIINSSISRADADRSRYSDTVVELIELLDTEPHLRVALVAGIDKADLPDIDTLDSFLYFVDNLIHWIPVERDLAPRLLQFHYIINQAPGNVLNENLAFALWMKRVAIAFGKFLDTSESIRNIDTFTQMPNYRMEDYYVSPSGWRTFNQFFSRSLRAGKRPVADACDDSVIVSPADSTFKRALPISDSATVTVKGVKWALSDLLGDSPWRHEFNNGVYMHSFLYVDDYHRYHAPVSGIVREVKNISGRVFLDVEKQPDGSLLPVDGDTFQFNQERGVVIIDSPLAGLVAVIPVGMTLISSVNLTPDVGAQLKKGDEIGFFLYGGSDVVLLFQDRNIHIEARDGEKYLQGERVARISKH